MKNIVLTGFMASGKSTVGRELSKKLSRVFYDTDQLIEDAAQTSISEIFAKQGETAFRDMESNLIQKLSSLTNCIISTGGGAVLRAENRENLRKNGAVVNLAPDTEVLRLRLLEAAKTRPLLTDFESAKRRMQEREPYYADCDLRIAVTAEKTPSDLADEIITALKERSIL